MSGNDVALVTRDLLFASRLRSALAGHALVRLSNGGDVGGAATVFVDLNDDAGARLELIRKLRGDGGGPQIIGFCGHDERALRVRAMAAGADQVVTNGALQEAALRVVTAAARG